MDAKSTGSIVINGGFLGQKITGLQRYAWEITRRLIADPRFRVACREGDAPESIPAGQRQTFSHPFPWNRIQVSWDLALRWRVPRTDFLWSPCNLGPLREHHAVSIHDLAPIRHPEWFSPGFRWKYRCLLPQLVRSARVIFTVSQTIRDELANYFPGTEDKIIVAYPGLSDAFNVQRNPDEASPLSATDRPYFVTMGSLDPRKNLDFVLSEWALFSQGHPDVDLHVIGGQSNAFTRQHYHIPGNCHFHGYLPDAQAAAILKGARALISASRYEGFNMPPLEAWGMGVPILLSSIPVHREIYAGHAHYFDIETRGSLAALLESESTRSPDAESRSDIPAHYNWYASARIQIGETLLRCAEQSGSPDLQTSHQSPDVS